MLLIWMLIVFFGLLAWTYYSGREQQEKSPSTYVIDVGRDFSPVIWGRNSEDGPYSGETFLDTILLPKLMEHGSVVVDFSNIDDAAISFSWLNAAFARDDIACMGDVVSVKSSEPLHWGYTSYANKLMHPKRERVN